VDARPLAMSRADQVSSSWLTAIPQRGSTLWWHRR